jgi:hypothetical protein
LRTRITYPQIESEAAAAHLTLLQGVIDDRVIPDPEHFGQWIFDPAKLAEDEHEKAVAAFTYEVYNLADEGLIMIGADDGLDATADGRTWDDEMTLWLEALIAIDEDRVYLVQADDGYNGYAHAWKPREEDEHDASGGVSLVELRNAGIIDWHGDMMPFITTFGGEFLDTYRPEIFDGEPVAA